MKNKTMSLRDKIKKIATKNKIQPQAILQNYMLERFLERLAISKYTHNIIIKGGVLITSLVGVGSRSTMDLDATILGINFTKDAVLDMFKTICAVNIYDNIELKVNKIEEIIEDAKYGGFRLSVMANLDSMSVALKFDFATGDKITPHPVKHKYKLLLENREIAVMSYPIETILAEKLQTIFARETQNTRLRDFYDVYILTKLHKTTIDFSTLKKALENTAKYRQTPNIFDDWKETLSTIQKNEELNNLWTNFQNKFNYASGISFNDANNAIKTIILNLNKEVYL